MRVKTEDGLDLVMDLAREFAASERATPVRSHASPDELRSALDLDPSVEGCSLDELAEDLRRLLEATPSTSSNRFFNQLFGGRDMAATVGDMLAAMANTSMYTFKAAGPQVLVEQVLIERMGRLVGYETCDGVFAPGGSMSNMVAMVVARNQAVEGARADGLGATPVAVYSSTESHYSIRKACGMIGIGRDRLRMVPVDDRGGMLPEALDRMIREDLARGVVPVMINATAGTTVRGSFDPIRELAAVAGEHGVWLHVDGAFGGSVALSDEHRELLDGSELSDSFTWDAHKMMGVPLTCSAILTRHTGALHEQFCEAAGYLFQTDEDCVNPGLRSIQCGRRNDALKLWTAWRFHGDAGYEVRIKRLFELVKMAVGVIEADDDLVLTESPQCVTVCFEVRGASSVKICELLDREARMKIGYGEVMGRHVIRLVCTNPEITESDLVTFFDEVKDAARGLPGDNEIRAEAVAAG